MIRSMVGEDIYFPGDPNTLVHDLQTAFRESETVDEGATVSVAPFGAYQHSLPYIVSSLKVMGSSRPDIVILLAPPHSQNTGQVLLPESDRFATPFGELPVHTGALRRLKETCRYFVDDEIAHLQNHSIEVLLPALHYHYGSVAIVPLLVPRLTIEQLMPLAEALLSLGGDWDTRVLVGANLSGFAAPREAEAIARQMIRLLMTSPGAKIVETIPTFESPPRSAWPLSLGHILAGSASRPHVLSRGSFDTEYEGDVGTVVFSSITYLRQ